MRSTKLLTIGHSTHSIEKLLELLARHEVSAVCDVRSQPYSRYNPQFNQDNLRRDLARKGIDYVFLGRELGARSDDASCYVQGRVVYERLAASPLFKQGLERIEEALTTHSVAILCAEKDPLVCHRGILVSRELAKRGLEAAHILEDGSLESYPEAVTRLRREERLQNADLFRPSSELDADAFKARERRIAYQEKSDDQEGAR